MMLSLCKTPMSLSSAQITGNFLRRKAPLSKIKAIVVPKLSNKTGQRVQAARLLSQFYGSKLHNKNLSVPHHNSYGEGLSRRRSAAHLMAVSYAESNPSRQNNDVSVDNLKVSQIKKVLDAGNVDYRDCLERRELVDRLKETQDFIPPSAQRLLQWYLQGFDDDAVSPISTAVDLNTTVSPVEGWWLEAERNTVKVFQESSPSVANITTSRLANVGLSMNPVEIPRGTGSAFVWDKEGHIVTNYHVVMDGNRARITLSDASTWDGEVVGVAKNKDLAVLKIKAPSAKLKPIAVGTSQALQVGQHVLAIGNPFGLDRTLTSGIISGVGRDIRSIGGAMIRGVIQTDASINPGNSGGPLLDSQGRLIGVNTAIYSPSGASAGVGFAIPVDTVRRVVNQIIRQGKVVRPGLGIICANDSQAKQLGVTGVLVLGVSENSAAARAGLIATKRDDFGRLVLGDIVVAVNGQTLSNVEDLMAAFDERQIGERVRITVKRGTSVRDVYITLEEITE